MIRFPLCAEVRRDNGCFHIKVVRVERLGTFFGSKYRRLMTSFEEDLNPLDMLSRLAHSFLIRALYLNEGLQYLFLLLTLLLYLGAVKPNY